MKILAKGKYYGAQHRKMAFGGVLLSKYEYTVPQTDWHYHENPYFMYVLHGQMVDANARHKTICAPGSLMFTNWQERHYGIRQSETASGFHLEFQRSWLTSNKVDLDLMEGSKFIENPDIHVLFAKLYYELFHPDAYSEVTCELLLLRICEVLGKVKAAKIQSTPDWVDHLIELLHYDTAPLSLQYLSKQLKVHPVHISRATPQYLNMGLGEYIRQHKLKKSIPLLLDTTRSLTSIAYETGFSDQSHFTRVFKSYFHMNPGQYRKKMNKK